MKLAPAIFRIRPLPKPSTALYRAHFTVEGMPGRRRDAMPHHELQPPGVG